MADGGSPLLAADVEDVENVWAEMAEKSLENEWANEVVEEEMEVEFEEGEILAAKSGFVSGSLSRIAGFWSVNDERKWGTMT